MPQITDPDILGQLNAPTSGRVTDPGLLAQLNGTQPSVGEDVRKSIVPSLERGPMQFLGSPQATGALVDRGAQWLTEHGIDPSQASGMVGPIVNLLRAAKNLPSTQDVEQAAKPITGDLYQPQTATGRIVGEGLSAATNPASYLGGEGSLFSKALTAVRSGLGAGAGAEVAGAPGAIIGGIGAATSPRAVLKAVAPTTTAPERQAFVDYLNSRGIDPTAGLSTGNRALLREEGTLGDALGSGSAYAKAQDQIGKQFTRAFLQHIGENADAATPEVFQRADRRLGQVFEDTAKKLPIKRDAQLVQDLTDISHDSRMLTEQETDVVHKHLDNVLGGFLKSGGKQMTGKIYQDLTRHGSPLDRAMDSDNSNVSYYATKIRSSLDDAMERTVDGAVKSAYARGVPGGPAQARAIELAESLNNLQTARRQWYNKIVLAKATASAGAGAGVISPIKVRQLLTSTEDQKINFAAGKGAGMQDLARAGDYVMRGMPNSNTTERHALQTIFSGAGAIIGGALSGQPVAGGVPAAIGAAAVPGIAGRALLSRPVQSYLKNRAPGAQAARRALSRMPGFGTTVARSVGTNPFLLGAPNPYAPQ